MDSREHSDPLDCPSARQAAEPGARRLRLVRRVDASTTRHVDALEAAHSSHHGELLRSLAAVEANLTGVDTSHARGAAEQISFIRVGLRCLADAIGELQAHIAEIRDDRPIDPCLDPAEPPQ